MKVIFGDMEFGTFSVSEDDKTKSPVCIVHKVEAIMELPNERTADALLKQYDCYLIPKDYKGEIYYSKDAWAQLEEQA